MNYIDCPEVLSFFNFNIPQRRIRSTTKFYVFTQKTNYVLTSFYKYDDVIS